jgi:hypothetical protein
VYEYPFARPSRNSIRTADKKNDPGTRNIQNADEFAIEGRGHLAGGGRDPIGREVNRHWLAAFGEAVRDRDFRRDRGGALQ